MRRCILLAVAVALAAVFIPARMFSGYGAPRADAPSDAADVDGDETVAVFLADENKTVDLAMRDYVIRCVAAEMPAAYEQQALCAQALASVTLARYMQRHNSGDDMNGARISTDPKKHQGYMTEEEMRERWGDDFDKYYQKLCDAVDETLAYCVTYEGEIALTAFHAMSPGVTEDARNVWDKSIPYLVSVDSAGDKTAEKYLTTQTFTADQLTEKLSLDPLSENEGEWLSEESYTAAGTLRSIKIGGKLFTGQELRSALGLRSAAIGITVSDGGFTFAVRGYGHGVGMSQYGANCLAGEGMTWREIIAHYYPGTDITEYESE